MVDYIVHGNTVTVAPSKHQTRGSGFGSEGTYSSDASARAAVSSGTKEGAIESKELAAKRRQLESPSAQWESQEAYEAAYTSYMQAGGTPISHPAGVIPGSTQEERRAEAAAYDAREVAPQSQVQQVQQEWFAGRVAPHAQIAASPTPILTGAMQRTRFDYTYGLENLPGISGEEWLASRRQQQQQQDPMRNIRRAAPVTAGLYETSASLTKQMQSAVGGAIGYSPTAHPGIKVLFGASSLITSLPQVVGMGAVVSEFAVRNPFKVPEAVVTGLPIMGGELVTQAKTSPFETAGMVAGMIVGGKAIKIISEKMPAVKVRGLDPVKISKTETFATGEVGPGIGDFWKGKTPSPGIGISKPHIITPASSAVALGLVPATSGNVYQGLSVEQGRKSQPIIGITDQPVTNIASLKLGDRTLVAGTPKFKPEAVPEIYKSQFMSVSGYRDFMNPTEFYIAMKNILPTYDSAIRELVEGSMAKRQLTFGVKSTHQLRDVPLEDVFTRHELGLATQKNLRAYMQQQKDFIIWGSTANKAQVMGKGGVGYFREVHDIDLHVKDPALTTKELLAVISKTEKPGKVTMKAGGLVTRKGHLFDIKTIEGGLPEEIGLSTSEIKKSNVFLFPEEKPVKIGKFTTQSLSSQATAKLSSLGLREKTVSAAPHRAGKDPFDLAFINEPSLTKDLARSLNPFKRLRAGKAEKLDIKIQDITESKIGKQTIGDMPGDITAQQKKLFFDNLRALRAGQPVTASQKSELLYVSRARSQPSLPAPGNIMRAGGILAPASQPHIRYEGMSYPGQPRLPAQTYDQGSISRQVHQAISSQKMMFSPPRPSGITGRSGMRSVRLPGYSAGLPASRSGVRIPSGSGRSIPVYPSGGIVYPRGSVDYPRISPPSPPVYPRSGVTYPSRSISPPSPPMYLGRDLIPRDQFKFPKMPKFDGMGGPRRTKGRRESAYEIRNPLAGLRELVGDIGFPRARRGKKNWWENL